MLECVGADPCLGQNAVTRAYPDRARSHDIVLGRDGRIATVGLLLAALSPGERDMDDRQKYPPSSADVDERTPFPDRRLPAQDTATPDTLGVGEIAPGDEDGLPDRPTRHRVP